jgi:hypothetical protein
MRAADYNQANALQRTPAAAAAADPAELPRLCWERARATKESKGHGQVRRNSPQQLITVNVKLTSRRGYRAKLLEDAARV